MTYMATSTDDISSTRLTSSGRDPSLDFIRLIAILMVIAIHVSSKGFGAMTHHWWAVNFWESVSRASVPLFLMVTGALLLGKETTVRKTLSRIWRVGLPLIVWSYAYFYWFRYTGTEFPHWTKSILRGPIIPHFWYLYTLLGAYLFLPVMIGFCQLKDTRSKVLTMAGWFVGASVLPTVTALTGKDYLGLNLGFMPLYAGYLIMGSFAYRWTRFTTSRVVLASCVWALSAALIAIFTWKHSIKVGAANETFYAYTSPFVITSAVSAFYVLRAMAITFAASRWFPARTLQKLGEVNFGVYLIHVMVMFWWDMRGFDFQFINPWLATPVVVVLTFLLSAAVIFVIQRLPFGKLIAPN